MEYLRRHYQCENTLLPYTTLFRSFDEVQTGWGMTGWLWAHQQFDLPCPPDVVTWAKKAQNGVLFVSEELATFFQEEKKFNTTDRKSTRLNSSHTVISYAVFCLKKK